MNKKILNIARRKFNDLQKQYRGFRTVFLDNWRGYRFIYDTNEIRKLPGKKFLKSWLYALLKNEKSGVFSASLYPATRKDKDFFGRQIFLNCKTYRQYVNCYSRFLIKRARTKEMLVDELNLIKNLRIVYSKNEKEEGKEKKFRRSVVSGVLKTATNDKAAIIKNYVSKSRNYF